MKKLLFIPLLLLSVVLLYGLSNNSIPKTDGTAVANPCIQNRVHRAGNVWFNVTNWGFIGNNNPYNPGVQIDPEYPNGIWAPQCEFPGGSNVQYLFMGALWVGAIVNENGNEFPRVSVGAEGWTSPLINELFPGEGAENGIVEQSDNPGWVNSFGQNTYDPQSLAAQEFIAVYSDTLTDPVWVADDPIDGDHNPLGIKVTQISRAWDGPGFTDFIIFQYYIENIDGKNLQNPYIAMFMDADIGRTDEVPYWHIDDLSGFLSNYEIAPGENWQCNLAYSCDNDGRPVNVSSGNDFYSPGVAGIRMLRPAVDNKTLSFNWWIPNGEPEVDFGPSWQDDNSGGWTDSLGTPMGDEHKYFLMSNGEIDYDQVYVDDQTYIASHPRGTHQWRLPDTPYADDIANGYDTRYLISLGPFGTYDHTDTSGTDIYLFDPGDVIEFSFALACGDSFHDYNNPQPSDTDIDPSLYDFENFVQSAYQAQQIFDSQYALLPPYKPVGLHKIWTPYNPVELAWDAHLAADFQEYELYRRESGEEYGLEPLNIGVLDTNYYLDASAVEGTEYYYRLRALDEDGYYSAFASEISVIAGAPNTPVDLRADPGNTDVELRWDPLNDLDLAGYRLYLSKYEWNEDTVFVWLEDTLLYEGDELSFIHTGLTNGLTYYYRVASYDTVGLESYPCERISAIPMGFDSGILLLDLTNSGGFGEIPNQAVIDTFYMDMLTDLGENFDYWNCSNCTIASLPSLEDLSPYEIVIAYSDDHKVQPATPPFVEPFTELLSQYLDLGGNLFLCGRCLTYGLLCQPTGYHIEGYWTNPFMNDYLKIASGYTDRLPIFNYECFLGAENIKTAYPPIMVDSLLAAQITWPGDKVPGSLVEIDRIDPAPCADTLYNYISATPSDTFYVTSEQANILDNTNGPPYPNPDSTNCYLSVQHENVMEVTYIYNSTKNSTAVVDSISWDCLYVSYNYGTPWEKYDDVVIDYSYQFSSIHDNHPCGVRYLSDDFRTVTLSFPLYFMEHEQSYALMEQALADFRIVLDTTPPELSLGVMQDPVLTQLLDIYLLSDEPLASASINVEGQINPAEETFNGSNVWFIDFMLTENDTIELTAVGVDTSGNTAELSQTFISRYVFSYSGDIIFSLDGNFSASIPPDALSRNTYVLTMSQTAPVAASFQPVGEVYYISPENAVLSQNIALTLSYNPVEINALDENGLAVYYWNESEWLKIPSNVNTSAHTVSAEYNKFGKYIVGWSETNLLPDKFCLRQNYPNPFNPSTNIILELPLSENVKIVVFNILGQKIASLADAYFQPGIHTFEWDGKSMSGSYVSSGLYFCKASAGKNSAIVKMLMVK